MSIASYYEFVPCCNPQAEPLKFRPDGNFLPTLPGVYLFQGVDQLGLVNGQCYTVTEIAAPLSEVLLLDVLPNPINFAYLNLGCADPRCPCQDPCFLLYNCEGFIIKTDSNLSAYEGQFVSLVEYPEECFFVTKGLEGECNVGAIKVTVDPDVPCQCDCTCYTITGTGQLTYLDCDLNQTELLIENFAPVQICSTIYPIVAQPGQFTITVGTACIDGLCPEKCFLLTNCVTAETIVSNSPSLVYYFNNSSVVTLVGYDGCWQISEDLICECPVSVTIQGSYATCQDCIPYKAYKLIGCDNPNRIIYSTTDLSAYVGKVISSDCGCLFVEEITYVPPADTVITVFDSYDNCDNCEAKTYLLTDCSGEKDPIYTQTDLSNYINQVVTIKFCPETCWTVTVSRIDQSDGQVFVESDFTTCTECILAVVPSKCVTFTNTSEVQVTIDYFNTIGQIIKENIAAKTTTPKVCAHYWSISESVSVNNYGLCINGECPVEQRPTRFVKPGYNTPACDPEKYEKITCNSSEILYKDALSERYGISNCCPDEDLKWLIKKELIDLDALVDPDYICTPADDCCPTSDDCGGYISMEITHLTCPERRCLTYNIRVQTYTDGLIYYRDCNNEVATIAVWSTKTPLVFTICGLEGQGPGQIYCDVAYEIFEIEQTYVICTP